MKKLLLVLPLFLIGCSSGGGSNDVGEPMRSQNIDDLQTENNKQSEISSSDGSKDIDVPIESQNTGNVQTANDKKPEINSSDDDIDFVLGHYSEDDEFWPAMGILSDYKNKKDAIKYLTISGQTFPINIGDNKSNLGNITKMIDGESGSFVFGAIKGNDIDINGKEKRLNTVFYKVLSRSYPEKQDIIAHYKGNAYAIKEGLDGVYKGDVNATINFGQHSMGGVLSNFGGNIKDISFQGGVGSSHLMFSSKTSLGFGEVFGNHIAGVIREHQDGKEVVASFGAKKQ